MRFGKRTTPDSYISAAVFITGRVRLEAPSKSTVEVFRRLGLSKYETSVILTMAANQERPLDYKEIMAETDVPYGKIHYTLAALERKGLISNLGGRPKRYSVKPIGEIVEDYIVLPVIDSLVGSTIGVDEQFRDVWIKQVTSNVPVVRVDEDGRQDISFISGIDELRRREYGEAQKAESSIRLSIPTTGFLDRKREVSLSIGENVSTEILTTLPPELFLHHIAPEERRMWNRTVSASGGLKRTSYYLRDTLTERMMIVDGKFASIGNSLIPVVMHIYSRKLCAELAERFEALKAGARLIRL